MSHFKSRVNMKAIKQKFDLHKNERGFTLVELLIASAVSLALLAVLAGVVTSQGNVFNVQNQLNQMQTNGRAATEIMSRAVANAGYNVFRGTKFQAASDHYISAVFDDNNDGIIQNNEVMTFAPGNNFTAASETIFINPYFDQDGDGEVSSGETATYPIGMTLTAPPFNLYKVLPNNVGTGVTRNVVARNIDNIVIRYYDNNDQPLPAGVALDGNGDPLPPYNFSLVPNELNNIRRVDIQVLARTQNAHPTNENLPQGDYPDGSVAAVVTGSTNFTDAFNRQIFTVSQAPRNIVLAPWGNVEVSANPLTVNCPVNSSAITATVVDGNGDPVPAGLAVNFTASGDGTTTVNPVTASTNASGEASTTVTYDWTSPNSTITLSASSLINVSGVENPVFNAIPVEFQSGNGTFTDLFEGGMDPNWLELDNPADIDEVDTAPVDGTVDALIMAATGLTRAVNGCSWQKYQVEFELTPNGDIDFGAFGPAMVGGFLRYESQNNNYSTVVEKTAGNCIGGDGLPYCLKIIHWDGAVTTLATLGANLDFTQNIKYKMLAQAEDNNLRVKIWNANLPGDPIPGLGLADPNPGNWDYTDGTFPTVYRTEGADTTIASGQIGLIGDWTNGANVIFDNFSVTPIN